MGIVIKKMQPEDWEIMQRLNTEVFENDKQHVSDLDCNWPQSEIGIKYFKKVANGLNNNIGFIALEGDEAVGYIALSIKRPLYRFDSYVEIDNMGVTPKYRSKGVGKKLLDTAKRWATEQNIKKLYVSAFSGNTKGITFYKKFGFNEISVDFEMKI